MKSREAKKAQAAFDELAVSLKRISALPPNVLTLDERLTLWAQLESLRRKLTDLVRGGLEYNAKQKPGQ